MQLVRQTPTHMGVRASDQPPYAVSEQRNKQPINHTLKLQEDLPSTQDMPLSQSRSCI